MLQHYNTINECLIAGSQEERVLDKVILPELHMMIGNVNHLLRPIQELWLGLMDWLKDNSVIWRGYQGGGLDGNNSMKLLQKIHLLRQKVPTNLTPILDVLQLFK